MLRLSLAHEHNSVRRDKGGSAWACRWGRVIRWPQNYSLSNVFHDLVLLDGEGKEEVAFTFKQTEKGLQSP